MKIIEIMMPSKNINYLFSLLCVFESHVPIKFVDEVHKSFIDDIHLLGGR